MIVLMLPGKELVYKVLSWEGLTDGVLLNCSSYRQDKKVLAGRIELRLLVVLATVEKVLLDCL